MGGSRMRIFQAPTEQTKLLDYQHFDVVIVGAGHAGAQTAIALRVRGFVGSIALVSDENTYPYERPPLSKDFLAGKKPFERLLIRKPDYWHSKDISLLFGCEITAVDSETHCLTTSAGGAFTYGNLIWAAGGKARRLTCDGVKAQGVHVVRTIADVQAILAELNAVAQVAIIGGGYIGLEAAAVLRGLGKQVTVLEAQNHVLARVAGAELSGFYENLHRTHGVDIRLNVQVAAIEESEGRVCAVRLAGRGQSDAGERGDGGKRIPAQLVIVGIGIVPSVEPLAAAGAAKAGEATGGVLADSQCRAIYQDSRKPIPQIYVIGDCAAHFNRYAAHINSAVIRLESVQNAHDQAQVVAQNILGHDATYTTVPWFWSQQYNLKLQTVGLSIGHDETAVRGDISSQCFSVVYLCRGTVIALDCINSPRDYVQGRALVVGGAKFPQGNLGNLANGNIPLKEFAKAQALIGCDTT